MTIRFIGAFLVLRALLVCPGAYGLEGAAATLSSVLHHREEFMKGQCRGLHDAYMSYLPLIDQHEIPERYLVYVPNRDSGLADRITGMVTAFYAALLSRRLFVMYPYPADQAMEKLYIQPFYNWSSKSTYNFSTFSRVTYPPQGSGCPGANFTAPNGDLICNASNPGDPPSYIHVNYLENAIRYRGNDYNQLWGDFNFRDLAPDAHTVLMGCNKGRTITLFNNPYHREELYGMGLTAANAFGCVMDFLLFPRAEVFQLIEGEINELMKVQVRIGVQIRTGDHAFGEAFDANGSTSQGTKDHASAYFDCALGIERRFAVNGAQTKWIVLSDSRAIRHWAREAHADRVVSVMHHQPEHVRSSGSLAGLYLAAAEHWVLGLCNFFVLTEGSGFGRTGAMRLRRVDSMYTARGGRDCSNGQFDDLNFVKNVWSGI